MNLMSKRKIITTALLLLAGGVWAQHDYRKGYIITNQQDTIYGWIDYRGDIRNAKICSFKESETGQATDYSPSDIAAYRFVDSKFYISRNIGSTDEPKQVFLEYLVNGLAKLYYYRDDTPQDRSFFENDGHLLNKSPNLYFIENDGQFLELKIDKMIMQDDSKSAHSSIDSRHKIISKKSYVGILKATLNVWEMNSEIDKAKLEHESLINITRNYHQYACTDGSECIVYEKQKSLIVLRIGPMVGADLTSMKLFKYEVFRELYFYYSPNFTIGFDPSTNYTVGINLNFSMPRINEKLSIQLQPKYSKYYFFKTLESPEQATDIQIKSNVLQMGLALKYEYPKGKWRPTLAAGAAIIWLPDGSIEINIDKYFDDRVKHSREIFDFPTKNLFGFEIIPGIHFYLTPKRIIFAQAHYLHIPKNLSVNIPVTQAHSFGLSAGIYFK
jgi:hypothetical protein